jgi:SAM-dependent methyltransferase
VVSVRELPAVLPPAGERGSDAGEDHPMRRMTRLAAFHPEWWGPQRIGEVETLFDGLAAEWHTRASEERMQVVADAFERGGPVAPGRWLEVGSGTGLVTPWLAGRARTVVALDLSSRMLALAPAGAGPRVRADAARAPFAGGAFDAVVAVNAFLFPAEVDRLLAPGGALVWVNTSGSGTPIHLPAGDVVAALGGAWEAVASQAGWGTWTVARRR